MSDPTSPPKRLFVRTFGCQMNVYDSERMGEALGQAGYVAVDRADEADLVLLNTCHIREKAAEKVYSEIGRLRKEAPKARIGVAGCVAQAEGAEIIKRVPDVDLVVGPSSYHRLAALDARMLSGEKVVETEFPEEDKFQALGARPKGKRGPAAFLSVQEGCDKFCAFCVVPYTRGVEVSRPVADVLAEARDLVARGVREITLLGQNVNAYHGAHQGREEGLGTLIRRLAEIDGLARLRYTTSHPRDMDEDLITAHRDVGILMPYLHLPVQSGSDRILKRMNRGHTAAEYLRLIERIRDVRPDILMSGDFITGFPEESEQDFEDTLALVREVGYGYAYSFKYSPRPGTPAAKRDQVPEEVKAERLSRLQAQITSDQRRIQDAMLGREMEVLFEKPGREPGQMTGKSPYLHAVHVTADVSVGSLHKVRITRSLANSLAAELI